MVVHLAQAALGVVLRSSGYEPLLSEDGRDAADRLGAGLIVDAVLTDIRMPPSASMTLTNPPNPISM